MGLDANKWRCRLTPVFGVIGLMRIVEILLAGKGGAMTGRWMNLLLVVAVLTIGMAACGPEAAPTEPPTAAPTVEPSPTAEPTEAEPTATAEPTEPDPTATPEPSPTATAEPDTPTPEPTVEPTSTVEPSPTSESSGEEPAVAEGETLLQERCTVCHTLARVESAQKTRDAWASTVDRMIGYGAQLSDAERTVVIDYLAETYGP